MRSRTDIQQLLFCGRPLLGRLLKAILDPLQVSVQIATDGESLLTASRQRQPDLLLLQLPLADIDAARLGEQLQHLDCPWIVLQANDDERLIRQAMAGRCDYCLRLPLDAVQLLNRLDQLLGLVGCRRSARIPADMTISFEDFQGIFIEQARDISAGGMFIEMRHPLEVGTPLRLSFQLPEPVGGQVLAWAKVVRRVTGTKDVVPGIGVRFISLDPVHRRRLQELAERPPERKPGDNWTAHVEMNAWPQARKPEDDLLGALDRELRLLEQQRGMLVKRLQQLETRRLLAETIIGDDARTAARACLQALRDLGGDVVAAIYYLDGTGAGGECLAALPDDYWPAATSLLPALQKIMQAAGAQTAVVEKPTLPENLPQKVVVAPLPDGECPAGVLVCGWPRTQRPGDGLLRLVELCAGQLAGLMQ